MACWDSPWREVGKTGVGFWKGEWGRALAPCGPCVPLPARQGLLMQSEWRGPRGMAVMSHLGGRTLPVTLFCL